jgi:aspartate 1-decarboxylase
LTLNYVIVNIDFVNYRNFGRNTMYRAMCKSKIHRATVTETNLNCTGSITIDKKLLQEVDILHYERVQIANINNGTRVETYVIEGEPDSGAICLNGAAARWAAPGDKIIIISYCQMEETQAKRWKPKIVLVDENNKVEKILCSPHSSQ